jgi:hypothetical protein
MEAIFNWDLPVDVSSVFTNANKMLSSKTKGGLEEVKRTAMKRANL